MRAKLLRPITFGQPGEEIGKKDLDAIVQRFKNLHKLQLQRIQAALTPRQRDFLELLPLLFHVNYPLLPGYVDRETPAGIPDYQPSRQALLRTTRWTRSFEYKQRALPNYPIQGLFLMGSVGSIAYSHKSDLDIWLCHDPKLEGAPLEKLRQKASAIEKWALMLKLKAHIFFINPETFRAGQGEPISTESCGSIQHHLLLEEFYRTSLFVAGRSPAWWMVPPHQDAHYTEYLHHLLSRRFVSAHDIIDFGGLEHVPAGEFLGGTLWHLHKAIHAPHKSLLKLLLMESYAYEYPTPDWLCNRLKKAVYAGSLESSELDAYILMYRKVDAYLREKREYDRLDLARQCFYLKINELLSVPVVRSTERHYRRDILTAIVDQWGWPPSRIEELDARRQCRISQVLEEHQRIVHELTRSYQSVNRFAREHAESVRQSNDEVILLGRKLYAALERKPGKVEPVSQDIFEELWPEELTLRPGEFADGARGWELRAGPDLRAEPLKRARGLLEILAWLSFNGFYRRQTRLVLENGGKNVPGAIELRNIMQALSDFLRAHVVEQETLEEYGAPPQIRASALFINLDEVPEDHRKDDHVLTSNRFDPFSYGAMRVSLIGSVDHVAVTTWQEVLIQRQRGLEGLFDCCCAMIDKRPKGLRMPVVECHGFGAHHAQSIVFRVRELVGALVEALESSPEVRYVIRGATTFYLFEQREGLLKYRQAADESMLLAELAAPRVRFGPILFDRWALDNSPLPLLYSLNREGVIQIFCRPVGTDCEVYILDERGSLFHQFHCDALATRLFSAYALFFSAIEHHSVITVSGLEFFLLETGGRDGGFQVSELEERPKFAGRAFNVRIHGMELEPGRITYTVYCNDKEFSSMEWGDRVFAQAAAHIVSLRQSGERYPIHVTDLDAPLSVLGVDHAESLQTIHFLNFKRKVEERLTSEAFIPPC